MRAAWIVIGCVACGDSAPAAHDAATERPAPCEPAVPWATGPDLPLGATQETAVVAAGGKLYVLGGFDGASAVVAAVQVFDPATCTWAMGPALPQAIHHANAAVVDGTIYVVGAMETIAFTAIPNVWAWNPATQDAWVPRAAMPGGTQRGSAVTGVIDGKIYVAGGLRGGAVNELSMYDPATNTWTGGLPAVPMTRDHGCGGVVNGKLYVVGGRQGAITSQATTVYEFTPGADWAVRAAMPTARGGTACAVVGDTIVVVGGEGNAAAASGVFPQVEIYDAVANTWEARAMMRTPRHGMGAAAIDGRVYVPGGATKQGFGAVATFEILTP